MGYVTRGGEGEEGTLQGEERGRRVRYKGRGGGGGYTAKGGEEEVEEMAVELLNT